MPSFRLHQDLSPGWKRHNSASSDRNTLLSLLLLPLFTYGLIRVATLPSGIRRCFSVTYCPVSTRTTNRKCLLFLGKPLWLWPAEGQKAQCCQQEAVFGFSHWKWLWQVLLGSSPPLPPSFPSQAWQILFLGFLYNAASWQCRTISVTHSPSLEHRMRIVSHCIYKLS